MRNASEDRAAFANLLLTVAAAVDRELPEDRVTIYFAAMGDLELDQVRHACAAAIKTLRFFPTVAELRELATPYVNREAEGALAFEAVCKMGHYSPAGPYWNIRDVAEAMGPIAAAAYAAAGGSRAFANEQGESNLPFLRKRFVESYGEAAQEQARGREILPPAAQRELPLSPVRQLVQQVGAHMSLDTRDRQLPASDRGDAWEAAP